MNAKTRWHASIPWASPVYPAVLLTCRQIYREAEHLLYRPNVLDLQPASPEPSSCWKRFDVRRLGDIKHLDALRVRLWTGPTSAGDDEIGRTVFLLHCLKPTVSMNELDYHLLQLDDEMSTIDKVVARSVTTELARIWSKSVMPRNSIIVRISSGLYGTTTWMKKPEETTWMKVESTPVPALSLGASRAARHAYSTSNLTNEPVLDFVDLITLFRKGTQSFEFRRNLL